MTGVRVRFWLMVLLAAAAAASTFTSTAGAATLTYPANGVTVSLDRQVDFTFTWQLPSTETGPRVMVSSGPNYDGDIGYNCQPDADSELSCSDGYPWATGTYYAFVQTYLAADGSLVNSPLVHFAVPAKVGWSSSDPWGTNPPVEIEYFPYQSTVSSPWVHRGPYGLVVVQAWVNDPHAKLRFTYVARLGKRVVKRGVSFVRVSPEDWDAESGFFIRHIGGVPIRHRVRCTITVSADGVSVSRQVWLRNPPPLKH